MSTLTSASTDAAVWAAYDDNASYEEDASATKAAAFITAARILLRRRPASMAVEGEQVAFDAQAVRDELLRASRWYATNRTGTAGGVRFLDFSGIRS